MWGGYRRFLLGVNPLREISNRSMSVNVTKTCESTPKRNMITTFKAKTQSYLFSSEKYKLLFSFKPEFCSLKEMDALKRQVFELNTFETISVHQTLVLLNSTTLRDHINSVYLDKLAASHLEKCTVSESIVLGFALFNVLGKQLFIQGAFYHAFMKRAEECIVLSEAHQQLVLMAFFCSLHKTDKVLCSRLLKNIYERFKRDVELLYRLDVVEISILCNAWFANRIVISSKPILRFIDGFLIQEIKKNPGEISQDSLAMLKVLRKACFASNILLECLAETITFPTFGQLNLAEATHALALLADHRYPLPEEMIINIGILIRVNKTKPLQLFSDVNVHPTQKTRIKDITRFMWAVSCLTACNHQTCIQIAEDVIEMVETAWNAGSYRSGTDYHLLSDVLLSLACWNVYPENLIRKIISQSFVDAIIAQNQTIRQSRLALFLAAAKVDAPYLGLPDSFFSQVSAGLRPYKLEKELGTRNYLAKLVGWVNRHREQLRWSDINCGSLIPFLNMAGLTFRYDKQKIAIEVLDSHVCMRHTCQPERLLALKIRLLEKQGYRVYQLNLNQANYRQREAEVQDEANIDQIMFNITQWLNSERI